MSQSAQSGSSANRKNVEYGATFLHPPELDLCFQALEFASFLMLFSSVNEIGKP